MFVYRWEMMRELLDRHKDYEGDAHDGLMVEYVDPTNGQPVFQTITFFVQMIQPGQKTLPVKSTSSLVVSPFEGRGHAIVEGRSSTGASSIRLRCRADIGSNM